MKYRSGKPHRAEHIPLPATKYDAPVVITGTAAAEIRRVAKRAQATTERSIATVASSAVLHGLPIVERDIELTSKPDRRFTRAPFDTDEDQP